MIADLMAFAIDLPQDPDVFFGQLSDHEERAFDVVSLQDVQDLRRPIRVGSVVEAQRHLLRLVAILLDRVGERIGFHRLLRDHAIVHRHGVVIIHGDDASPVLRTARDPQNVPFDEKNDRVIGPAESRSALDQRVQHGLDVRRRAADHAKDLARRRLLLQRLGQLAVGIRQLPRARFHFVLQALVGLLEACRHAVERLREGFDLVARVQLDRLVERPGADPRRAFLEYADRRDHSPGQENAGQHRESEAQHENDGAPDDRGPEGSVGGGGGTLDEDEPPEGSNRGVGRQHLPAAETSGDHSHRSARRGCRATGPG